VNISAPFIRRPIATSLMAAALVVVGAICYVLLPVSALPQVEYPTLQVSAQFPGSSPTTMASNIATPLERQMSLIPGLTQLTSTSTLGTTQIVLQFELGKNLDAAQQDVQSAINAAGGQLPSGLPNPPTIRKVNPSEVSAFVLALSSEVLPFGEVSNYADTVLAQKVSRLPGVGQVQIAGALKPAIRIRIDPRRAAALGLNLDSIRSAIALATANAPKGQLLGRDTTMTVYANDQVLDVATWNDLIVGYKAGAAIRIKDIGEASLSAENLLSGAWAQPKPGLDYNNIHTGPIIGLLISKEPGANIIKMVEGIKAAMPALRANVPPGLDINVLADRTLTIRASVQDVQITLLITVVLVVGVIFLFLRDWKATAIASAVIPTSILATAAIMLPARFSLDNLSLMALTVAVGFVVDDAIVMVEVIWRRIERGQTALEAAMMGAKEIAPTILTISLSLIAAFTPLMFMGGVVGKMMQEFALVLASAVVVSVILSLTLTPMLCARFLKRPAPARGRFMRGLETGFHRIETGYARALDRVLKHRPLTLAVFASTLIVTGVLYSTSKTGFFPQQDTGFLQGAMQTAPGTAFDRVVAKARQAVRIIAEDPDVSEAHYVFTGDPTTPALQVVLKQRNQGRRATATDVLNRLRPKLGGIVGTTTALQAVQDITIGGRTGSSQFQYTVTDGDTDELNQWAPRMLAAMQALPELKDVTTDQKAGAPSATLEINRNAANRFGISATDIDAALYNQIGNRQVAQYFTQLNNYRVIMEAPLDMQLGPDLFGSIFINSPRTGKPVPLSALVQVDTTQVKAQAVAHQDQFPAATISFNLTPGVALGAATQAVERAREQLGAPPTLTGAFQGTAQAFQASLKDEPVLILAALLSVYVILGVLYESYVHPLTILSTLPSAGLGALLALRIAGRDLDVIGIIAIILLIGIVKKNGIMIVDVALRLQRESGLGPLEAVRRASNERLRPILMTTACAMLGGLPMILTEGTGSEFRQPLGWAIVGGLLVSQVMTLFTTPVIYLYLDRFHGWTSGRKRTRMESLGEAKAAE
jgi:HAE1 family hydrophobic/amphiphilic exporter-1